MTKQDLAALELTPVVVGSPPPPFEEEEDEEEEEELANSLAKTHLE